MPKVLIVGAGLVGSLAAIFMAKRGWQVEVYERRPDDRVAEQNMGRSISLTLSYRGICALKAVGLDYIIDKGIRMEGRMVHEIDSKITRHPYGQPGECLFSISRSHLNKMLIQEAEKFPNVHFHFEHKVLKVNPTKGTLHICQLKENVKVREEQVDLILACDGSRSSVRKSLMNFPYFQFSQEYIEQCYVQLVIPPKEGEFALEPNFFHVWPREKFYLRAAAQTIDKTFNTIIFATRETFEQKMRTPEQAVDFFKHEFSDAFELLGEKHIAETFEQVQPSTLPSIKCDPHSFDGKVLLLGDAAHAMVSFLGQGMNSGFEDCLVLNEILDEFQEDIPKALEKYSKMRSVDAHAVVDLSMRHYKTLTDMVKRKPFVIKKYVNLLLNRFLGDYWIPSYSMVTFKRMCYSEVMVKKRRQDKILNVLFYTVFLVILIMGFYISRKFHIPISFIYDATNLIPILTIFLLVLYAFYMIY